MGPMTPANSRLSNRSAPRRPHPARGVRSRVTGRWALAVLLLAAGCDFSLLESPKLPIWDIALTMPLINQAYPLAGVVDSSTIFADSASQELQIQFDGALDTTRIDDDFLEITLPAGASPDPINESVTAPNAADFFSAVAESVVVSFALDDLLTSAGAFGTISFPQGFDFPIDSSDWNSIMALPPVSPISQVQGPTQLLDTTALLSGNSIIKTVRYITLSAAAGANEFITSVFNDDFPTNIDSIVLQLDSGPLTVIHSRATLTPGNTFAETTDLASAQLGTDLTMSVNLQLPVTTADTVWILAGTDPKIDISVKLAVAGIDSIGIRTKQTSIVPVVPTGIALPAEVSIISGQLRSGEIAPINTISLTGLRNTLPFDIKFELQFPNFSTSPGGGDTLTFGPYTLTDGAATINETKDLSVYTFLNPDPAGGDTTAIDSFEYSITAEIVEADMALPLDGSSLGAFQVEFGVGDLYFQSITGEFEISFDAINTTIEDIPTGFAGFEFARLSLSLLFSNEIDLPVELDLNLIGVSLDGDSATVPINAPLNYPSAPGTTDNGLIARTLIVLDEISVRTYWLTDGGATVADAWKTFEVPNDEESIVDVLNLPPETIIVGGGASIQGTGTVAAGSALWGEFQLIAPFAFIMPRDITFLPANAFALTPMDADTRKNVQTALLSASLTVSTLMDLPIGGSISMLISDSTIFSLALDSLDDIAAGIPTAARTGDTTVYSSISAVLLADSIVGIDHIIFYAETATLGQTTDPTLTRAKKVEFYAGATDTVPAFFIGRLFEMTLPGPRELNSLGHVVTPGDTTETLQLDAERLGWIASETAMHMQPLITFHGGSEVRTFQTTDSIHILAFLTLNLSSDILGAQEPKDSSSIAVTQVPNKSIVVGDTVKVDLATVFALTGVPVTDMETAVVTSHTGIAAVRIINLPGKKIIQVVGIGTGTAKITVTADDDGDDNIDAATVAFQVIVNASGSMSPASPAVEWDEDVLELIRIKTARRPVQ